MDNSLTSSFQKVLKKCYKSNFSDTSTFEELTEIRNAAKTIAKETAVAYTINSSICRPNDYDINEILVYAVEHDSLYGTLWALQKGGKPDFAPVPPASLDCRSLQHVCILSSDSVSPVLTAKKHFNLPILNLLKNPDSSYDFKEYYSDDVNNILQKLYASDFADQKAYKELQTMKHEAQQIEEHYKLASAIQDYNAHPASRNINKILHRAVAINSVAGVKWALQNGANVNETSGKEDDAMQTAIIHNSNISVLELLAQQKYDFSKPIKSSDGNYSNLLAYTAHYTEGNNYDIFKFVLDHSSQQDIQNSSRVYTVLKGTSYVLGSSELKESTEHKVILAPVLHSLCSAVTKYTPDCETSDLSKSITALLDAGYDIRTKDENGLTAMDCAVRIGRLSTVLELQKRGISLNDYGADGKPYLSHLFNEDGSFKDFSYNSYRQGVNPENESSDRTWHFMENGVEKTYTEQQLSRLSLDQRNVLLKEIYALHISNEKKRSPNFGRTGKVER